MKLSIGIMLRITVLVSACLCGSFSSECLGQLGLRILETNAPSWKSPYHAQTAEEIRLASLFADPLFKYYYSEGKSSQYIPILAKSCEVFGNDVLRVYLRPDSFFYKPEDGNIQSRRVKARDVLTTYRNITNQKSKLRNTRYRDRLARFVKSANVLNDSTIEFVYNKDFPATENVLDFPIVPGDAIPEEPIELSPNEGTKQHMYEDRPWGSGRYCFDKESAEGDTKRIRFKRTSPVQEGDLSNYLTVEVVSPNQLKALLEGSLGARLIFIPSLPLDLVNSPLPNAYRVQSLLIPKVQEIIFNQRNPSNPALKDQKVRAALSMCINREQLIETLAKQADPVNGPIPFKSSEYCDTCSFPYYRHDTETAKALLKSAGWERTGSFWTKTGQVLKVRLLGYKDEGSKVDQFCASIAEAWKDFGVQSDYVTLLRPEYEEKLKSRDFDAAFHTLDYVFAPRLDRAFLSTGSENYSGYSSSEFDVAWHDLEVASVPDQGRLWHKLHKIVAEDVPCAFLWTPKSYMAWSIDVDVRNQYTATDVLFFVHEWKVKY